MNLTDSARLYEERGDYNMTIRYYERAARSESQDIKRLAIYMRLSSLYARVGRFDTAQARLENALTIISKLPEESTRQVMSKTDAEYCLALNALKKANYKRCIGLLEEYATDDAPDIHCYLSIAYGRQAENYLMGNSIPASQDLTTPSSEFRDAIDLINQGREFAGSGDIEEAKGRFKLALERAPDNGSAQNDYEKALLLLKKREYPKATRLFVEMRETADVNYYLGVAYQEQARISAQKAAKWQEYEPAIKKPVELKLTAPATSEGIPRVGACAASLVVPGLGQHLQRRHVRGSLYEIVTIGAGAAALWATNRYQQTLNDYEDVQDRLRALEQTPLHIAAQKGTELLSEARVLLAKQKDTHNEAKSARMLATATQIAFGVLWGINVLDAAVMKPAQQSSGVAFEAHLTSDGGQILVRAPFSLSSKF